MIKLLAKNQSGGRYYFSEEDGSVYSIKSPLAKAEKEFVDSLPVFLRKSFDVDLTYDEQEFESIEDLKAFAISDCAPENRGISPKTQEPLDILMCAPVEIVEEYFSMIEDMIDRKEFAGLALFFRQLSRNCEVLESSSLMQKKDNLKAAFDNARFANVTDMGIAIKTGQRIRFSRNVLSVA